MHTVVIRRDVYEKNRWVAQTLYKAFLAAKRLTRCTTRPRRCRRWCRGSLRRSRRRAARWASWWPYGIEPNRSTLETFLRYHHEQRLSKRRFKPEELFAPETLTSFKV